MSRTINDFRPETKDLIDSLIAAGCRIVSTNNGGDGDTLLRDGAMEEFIEEVMACDEARLNVQTPDGKSRQLYLVYGNSPGELVCDYHCHAVLDQVTEAHYEKWGGRDQPTREV